MSGKVLSQKKIQFLPQILCIVCIAQETSDHQIESTRLAEKKNKKILASMTNRRIQSELQSLEQVKKIIWELLPSDGYSVPIL